MPLPATHWQPVQAIVKMAPVPICHCEEANGRRGALSAKREEVPLGCNLGKAVTISPGVPCYPAVYREIATGAKRPRNDKSGAISILTIVCSGRERTDGSGMPLPYKIEKSRQETRRDADCQKKLPSRKFRREEKCERKPSGCPFASNNPPQRQNCKIMLQNFICNSESSLSKESKGAVASSQHPAG